MATGLVYDPRFLEHNPGPHHPERPERLSAIVAKLQAVHLWDRLVHLPVQPVDLRWIERLHEASYVRRVQAACESGLSYIDSPDSAICPASYETALLAAGGVLGAVDAVMHGRIRNAFCAVRPPGHHAERARAMGFCLFNTIAIAAHYLTERHRLQRVAIIDFDVHHGNGTQHLLEDRRDVLFVSLHEHPTYLYPGTGFSWESGRSNGEGFTINLPIDPRSGDEAYHRLITRKVLPVLHAFEPQFILLSAGFDASEHDPLAHLKVTGEGFHWISRQFKHAADEICQGRLVSILEGGYDLRSLAEAVSLHVSALLEPEGQDPLMAIKAGLA